MSINVFRKHPGNKIAKQSVARVNSNRTGRGKLTVVASLGESSSAKTRRKCARSWLHWLHLHCYRSVSVCLSVCLPLCLCVYVSAPPDYCTHLHTLTSATAAGKEQNATRRHYYQTIAILPRGAKPARYAIGQRSSAVFVHLKLLFKHKLRESVLQSLQ